MSRGKEMRPDTHLLCARRRPVRQDNLAAFPSTSANGISLTFGSARAPIYALAGRLGQIDVLVSTELPSAGAMDVTVRNAGGSSLPLKVSLAPAAPGIFSGALNEAGLLTGNVAPVNGNPLYSTILVPVVTIGELPARVLFSGMAPGFAGLYQVNVRIPDGVAAGDDVPIQISMANASDSATIAIN